MIFELTSLPLRGETNVTTTVQYAVSSDEGEALRQRSAAERLVEETLRRLQAMKEQPLD
jgi:hypothetical protein